MYRYKMNLLCLSHKYYSCKESCVTHHSIIWLQFLASLFERVQNREVICFASLTNERSKISFHIKTIYDECAQQLV